MAKMPHISIIGPGKVGTAIGVLAARAGWPLRAVGGRCLARARAAVRAIVHGARGTTNARAGLSAGPASRRGSHSLRRLARSAPLATPPAEAAQAGELVLLTVPDDAIEGLCRRLAAAGAFRAGAIVAHCSGALGSDVLRTAKDRGCRVGSLHPCQTFPTVAAAVSALPGAYCFIEGDAAAAVVLSRLARAIGGRPVRIAPGAKALYHAAACAASNYLVTLMDFSLDLGQAGGIGGGKLLHALEPLVRATVENIFRLGPAKALTGPIARGDARTVHGHLEAIRRAPSRVPCFRLGKHGSGGKPSRPGAELASLYAALAQRTIQLARRKGSLAPAAAGDLAKLIRSHSR